MGRAWHRSFGLSRTAQCAVLVAATFVAMRAGAFAGAGPEAVLKWRNIPDGTTEAFQNPLASRTLADATLLVVLGESYHLSLARFPPGSQTPDVVPIILPTGWSDFAFDPCGNLFVSAPQSYRENPDTYDSNAWLMKYDSTTGRPLWNEPFVWGDATDNYQGALPTSLFANAEGDALLTVETAGGYLTFRLDGLDGAVQWTSPLIPVSSIPPAKADVDEDGDLYFVADQNNQLRGWALDGGTGALLWGPLFFDSPSEDESIQRIMVDPEGQLLVAGNTSSGLYLLRLHAASGTVVWGPTKLSNASLYASTAGVNEIFVAGTRSPAPGIFAFFVATFDLETGTLAGGPVDFAFQVASFSKPSLVAASNGDVLVSAVFYDQAFEPQLGSGRIGRDGAVVWGLEFRELESFFEPLSLIEADGAFVELFASSFAAVNIARRNAATGQTVQPPSAFQGRWNDAIRFFNASVLPDGNLATAGTRSPNFTLVQTVVRKIDRVTGQELWIQSFPNGSPRLAADASGDLLSTSGFEMRKLDGDTGSVVWGPVPAAEPQSLPRIAAFDASGNVIIASTLNLSSSKVFLEKRSGATGALLWGPVSHPVTGNHRLIDMALDASGDVFVSLHRNVTAAHDWITFKHSGATGSILWGPVTFDRTGGRDEPWRIRVLPGGDAVVLGFSSLTDFEIHITAIRYAGANGSVVWGPVFVERPGGGPTAQGDMAVNTSGDIFITGYSWAPQGEYDPDLLAVKLVGATGSIAWGPSLHDTGLNDIGTDIALLSSGDPVALGYHDRWQLPGGIGPILFSWDGATGSLRWGPVQHEGFVDEYPQFLGVAADTIFVAADVYLNGIRPKGWSPPTTLLLAYVESLGIATYASQFLATCGVPFSEPIEASNVSGTASWTLIAGALPDGVMLSSAGLLSGTPTEVGEFPITVQVQDSSMATAARDFTLVVREDQIVPIVATPVNACTWQLSIPGVWSSYSWEPGGQTTPTITVSPQHDTVYGVTVGDGTGCATCGSISIRATRLIEPGCDAPGLTSISPTSGPAAGGTVLTLSGAGFEAGSQARIAGAEVPTTFQNPNTILATAPALGPGTLSHVLVSNPDLASGLILKAFFADFLDVPQSHIFHDFVEVLLRAQVTAGCGGGFYCPDMLVTRAQMSVFLLVAKNGPGYTPPPATGMVFFDVPANAFAAAFIEALAAAQVTGGCGGGNYCPDDPLTREQMAIFLLRTLEGPNYAPPSCTVPTFTDVPCSSPFARWIEEIYDRGITAGCGGGQYCPLAAVSRGQMAVFLTETFGLP